MGQRYLFSKHSDPLFQFLASLEDGASASPYIVAETRMAKALMVSAVDA